MSETDLKPRTTRPRVSNFSLAVSLSVVVHATVFFGWSDHSVDIKTESVTPRRTKLEPVTIHFETRSSAPLVAEARSAATKHYKPNSIARGQIASSSSDPANNNIPYDDLLPSAFYLKDLSSAKSGAMEYSRETKFRNLSKLESVAREIAQYISIPSSVLELQPSGSAILTFKKENYGSWEISGVTGDSYYRALLYESIASIPNRSPIIAFLNASEYDRIRIELIVRTISELDTETKPLVTTTDANRIFIAINSRRVDPKWRFLMPIDNDNRNDAVLPDIAGIGSFLINSIRKIEPEEDPAARRLRNSPAFTRPISR